MERKELEYYLSLRYPVTVHPDPEGGFVGEIEELSGCMTQAETLDELFQVIEDARQLWIKTAFEEGQDIPLPRDMEKYTGKFIVRIPRGLHRNLARAAKQQGVSMNQYVTSLLSAGVSSALIGTEAASMFQIHLMSPLYPHIWKSYGSKGRSMDRADLVSMPGIKLVEKKELICYILFHMICGNQERTTKGCMNNSKALSDGGIIWILLG